MQTETLNAGQELDAKVRHYSAQHHCDYAEGLHAMKELEPDLWRRYVGGESALTRKVREGGQEFERRVVAYQEQWNLSRDEAVRRVASHDSAMKVYEQDPMRSREVTGTTEASPQGEATWTAMPDGEVRATALMQIAVLLGGLPKNPDGRIPFDKAARVLQSGYLDLLVKAAGEKLDSLTRAQIDIDAMPGITSQNYPQAFDKVLRKYPALAQIYSGGRIAARGLTDLLPHFLFAD